MNGSTVAGFLSLSGKSLAFRFNLTIGVALFIISAISIYAGSMLERRSLMKGVENQAGRVAELLAVSAASPLFTFNQDSLTSVAQAFGSDAAIRFLEIKDALGKVVASEGKAKDQSGVTLAKRDAKIGSEVVGSVSLGFFHRIRRRANEGELEDPDRQGSGPVSRFAFAFVLSHAPGGFEAPGRNEPRVAAGQGKQRSHDAP
jgi:hypothetical protein